LLTKRLNPSASNGPWGKKRGEILKYSLNEDEVEHARNVKSLTDWQLGERRKLESVVLHKIFSVFCVTTRRSIASAIANILLILSVPCLDYRPDLHPVGGQAIHSSSKRQPRVDSIRCAISLPITPV
jgi:hypothetical protein